MFNVHNIVDDPEKLLIEIDVKTLISMFCCFGMSTNRIVKDRLVTWGLTSEEADDAVNSLTGRDYPYEKIKPLIIEKFKNYSRSKQEL